MFFSGKNKFPCQHLLRCCIGYNNSKRCQDLKVMCVCGPETARIIQTFLMINVPLIIFICLTFDFMVQQESVYKALMYTNVGLLPLVNYYLVRTAATDPGIIPARSW